MSISLLIKSSGSGQQPQMVPIATEDAFREYWMPAFEVLKLQWIPLFESGLPVDAADMPAVLAELRSLLAWLSTDSGRASSSIRSRLEKLIAALESVGGLPGVSIYIG